MRAVGPAIASTLHHLCGSSAALARVALIAALLVGCGRVALPPVLDDPFDAAALTDDLGHAASDARADVSASVATDVFTAPTMHVLFIGDSYIYVNDLPGILHGLAASAGVPPMIETAQVTVGGATLEVNWTGGDAPMQIAMGGWDDVVLQGQSVEPVFDPATFDAYARMFATAIHAVNARPVYYATWARAVGDPVYQEQWSGGSPAMMTTLIEGAYVSIADSTGGVVVPAGYAFRDALAGRPDLALYQSDGSHPTLAASYMVACAFYQVLTGRAVPDASAVPVGIDPTDARFLRSVATQAIAEAATP